MPLLRALRIREPYSCRSKLQLRCPLMSLTKPLQKEFSFSFFSFHQQNGNSFSHPFYTFSCPKFPVYYFPVNVTLNFQVLIIYSSYINILISLEPSPSSGVSFKLAPWMNIIVWCEDYYVGALH